ncbi:MAG: hypothetical protein GXP55_02655 [Deltaproteobacteria bacterium]|nr:hypothetical protein [Deltaproteobacteria bacterium]
MLRLHLFPLILLVLASGCAFFDGGDAPDAGADRLGGVGDACTASTPCRVGLSCQDAICGPTHSTGEGGACELTGDCVDGLYCGADRTCSAAGDALEGEGCGNVADCATGLVCRIAGLGGACAPGGGADIGASCETSDDCVAGLTCARDRVVGSNACLSPPAAGPGSLTPPAIPRWTGIDCGEDDPTARAYFDIPRGAGADGDFFRLPFPNDVRRGADGLDLSGFPTPGTVLPEDVVGRYVAASEAELDGFSTNPTVIFRFSTNYDWGSLGGNLRLVDIDPDSPSFGQDQSLSWLTTAGPLSRYVCENWLAVRSGHGAPLRPATTYAVLLLDGVSPSTDVGGSFARSPDLDALLADARPDDAILGPAWDAYADLRSFAAGDADTELGAVLNASVFTTQSLPTTLPGLRAAVRASSVDVADLTLCDDGVTSPCDDGTEQRACVTADGRFAEIHGHMTLPIFQEGEAPYEQTGGGIARGADGAPRAVGSAAVCFALTIPSGASMPAEGWPLALYAHGTGGSFRSGIGLAGELADAGVATLAIDMPQHGSRRGASSQSPDRLFFNFANPEAAKGNVLEGAADLFSEVFWAEGADITAADSPTGAEIRFDSAHVALFAHSQGATHAALALPFEPGIGAAVLSGEGGDLTQSLLTKSSPVDIAAILPFALLDPDGAGNLAGGDFHPVLALFQGYFDDADPVNYARLLAREPIAGGHHVFMTYGLGDTFATEATQRAFAQAGRLTLVEPVLTPTNLGLPTAPAPLSGNVAIDGSDFTVGLRQYMPDAGDDGHFVATRTTQGRADVMRFLTEALSGSVPNIGAP